MKNKLSNISKKSKMIAATAFVLGLAIMGGTAFAANPTSTNNPMSSLVSAIATKFNLNTADVQTVVDSVMTAKKAEMKAKHSEDAKTGLAQAVVNGKITQAQADLVSTKLAELKATMESDRTADQALTKEQRKAKMEASRTELTAWATANGIPNEYLRFIGSKGGPGGRGGHGGEKMNSNGGSTNRSQAPASN